MQRQMKFPMQSEKALKVLGKNIYTIEMEGTTIPHDIHVEWDGAIILLKAAAQEQGL